jgi:hypothetical protein
MSSTEQRSNNGTNHHHMIGFSGPWLRYAFISARLNLGPLYDTMMIVIHWRIAIIIRAIVGSDDQLAADSLRAL